MIRQITIEEARAKFPHAPESFLRRQVSESAATHAVGAMPAAPSSRQSGSSALPVASGKRIRQSAAPVMNKLESQWLMQLERMYQGCRIVPQGMRVKIATGAWYKVDFFIPARMVAFEVKGPKVMHNQQSRQLLALKVAASQWPEIAWWLVWWEKGGEWKQQRVLS
jgi:hypothetical protein